MLPRGLYELLPYLYLAIGSFSGLMIDSTLILIASLLLIAAGALTLYTRWNYRKAAKAQPALYDETTLSAVRQARRVMLENDRRSGSERRKQQAIQFPLTDSVGRLIRQERRRAERRSFDQQSMA